MTAVFPPTFRVALTADFYDDTGKSKFADIGIDLFREHDHIQVDTLNEHRPVIGSDQIDGFNAIIVLTPQVIADTLANAKDLLVISRFGVGFDGVDVGACTENNILATITTGAVDHSVAEATVGWLLALTHHVLAKDKMVRSDRWNDRARYMGRELRDRTLGVVGLGGIGQALVSLLGGFGMRQPIAYDPLAPADIFQKFGVRSVTLNELLQTADFVSLHCPLNEKTRGLIGERELQMMKPGAYLLNTARGCIVDEDALYEALANGRIAGAAIDCFEREPVIGGHRFCDLDNVILAPHSIAWTDELFRDIGRTACQSIYDVSVGQRPKGVLNPELFESDQFLGKWARIIGEPVL